MLGLAGYFIDVLDRSGRARCGTPPALGVPKSLLKEATIVTEERCCYVFAATLVGDTLTERGSYDRQEAVMTSWNTYGHRQQYIYVYVYEGLSSGERARHLDAHQVRIFSSMRTADPNWSQ